jgi:hypothetical protein
VTLVGKHNLSAVEGTSLGFPSAARQLFNLKPSGRALAIAGLVCLFLLSSPGAGAQSFQDLPDAPKPKLSQQKVFDLETVTELELVAGSLAADAMSTEKAMEFNNSSVGCGVRGPHCQRFGEGNPIARVFVRNRAGTGLYFGGVFALDVYSTYLLRKHHHPRIARIMNLGFAALEGVQAGKNYAYVNSNGLEFLLHHPSGTAAASISRGHVPTQLQPQGVTDCPTDSQPCPAPLPTGHCNAVSCTNGSPQ